MESQQPPTPLRSSELFPCGNCNHPRRLHWFKDKVIEVGWIVNGYTYRRDGTRQQRLTQVTEVKNNHGGCSICDCEEYVPTEVTGT